MDNKPASRLEDEIRALIEENRQLRAAAQMFGQLAERLNRQLQAERKRQTTATAAESK
jgi:hypothetical protein